MTAPFADLRRRAEQEAVHADNAKFARLATLLRDLLAEQDRLLAALTAQEQEVARLHKVLAVSADTESAAWDAMNEAKAELSRWRSAQETDQ